ncbi:MAG TPA: class I SAM-dependent methyltransferase [Candidatus Baltobacteraceae bacterium]|nr:class I SAM-dependent methyltransferase [Candidatus Baltobacteraceae bacterium]
MTKTLRDRVTDVDSPTSLSGRARARRWVRFSEVFPEISEMRVLDLGGTPMSWRMAPVRPAALTIVNLMPLESEDPTLTLVRANACQLPEGMRREKFDLVYSNSLLEHVGGHIQRQRLVENVHHYADRHWVQTPYRYFPVEPHWLFPGFQWLPYGARIMVSQKWNRGHIRTYTRAEAEAQVNEIDLIGIAQMRMYFPTSTIWYERFAGLVKSLVAIRANSMRA